MKKDYDILLMEDDEALCETLQEMLEEHGYSVYSALDAQEAIDASYRYNFSLYIFDINVPDMDGITLLKSLRNAEDTTQTIIISAMVDLSSITAAFEAGAFDYLKKPFYPEELLLRVEMKLKEKSQKIAIGAIEYDPQTKLFYKDGKSFYLSQTQQCLWEEFLLNLCSVVDKALLLECLAQPSETALRVAINKLKKELGVRITNVRGVGYMLEKN